MGTLLFKIKTNNELTTVVGYDLEVPVGTRIKIEGEYSNHPKFGRQFISQNSEIILPKTIDEIEKYLGSGLIKGIGPKTAKLLINKFGEETLNIIKEKP